MHASIGKTVKDMITGFEGIVTGRVEYITGCNQLLVQPPVKDDGEFVENRWFDEDRMKVTDDKAIAIAIKDPGPDTVAPRK